MAEYLIISNRITVLTNRIPGVALGCVNSAIFHLLDNTRTRCPVSPQKASDPQEAELLRVFRSLPDNQKTPDANCVSRRGQCTTIGESRKGMLPDNLCFNAKMQGSDRCSDAQWFIWCLYLFVYTSRCGDNLLLNRFPHRANSRVFRKNSGG